MGGERKVTRIRAEVGPQSLESQKILGEWLYQAQLPPLLLDTGAQGPTLFLGEKLCFNQRDGIRVAVSGSF